MNKLKEEGGPDQGVESRLVAAGVAVKLQRAAVETEAKRQRKQLQKNQLQRRQLPKKQLQRKQLKKRLQKKPPKNQLRPGKAHLKKRQKNPDQQVGTNHPEEEIKAAKAHQHEM